jgi:murein DD-endopeptidase MepM/ murein hydrolase activator NlpD
MRRLAPLFAALVLVLWPRTFVLDLPPGPLTLTPPPDALTVIAGTIGRNATLESVLGKTLSPAAVHHLVQAARPIHDLARLSIGQPFRLTLGPDGVMSAFTYGIDELRTLNVKRNGTSLEAALVTRTYETRVETVSGLITSSLFGAVSDAGEEDLLAVDLAAIFEWDVDFNTELQKGDSFRLAVEKQFLDGQFSRYGSILAAELLRGDRVLRAVRFASEKGTEYFTPEGLPLRKTFLRSPLKFTRISSGFTHARFHPVLQKMRPHLGVDYAAPTGTPVRAAADGTVVLSGWSGGYGKTVRIRHGRGLETLYGHLSRIDVTRGQHVDQGTLIGAVGATGLATGPHLDYRTLRDGVYVNPLTIQPPPAEPVSAALRPAFLIARDKQMALLGGTTTPSTVRQASGADPAQAEAAGDADDSSDD